MWGIEMAEMTATTLPDADRAMVYRLLSDLFARELRADGIVALAGAAEGEAAALASLPQLQPVFVRIREMAEQPDRAALDLASAFAFLFLGLGGRNGAPPYESVHRDAGGLVAGEPTAKMERELAELDIHIQKAFPEPADHVAIELAVAATLAETGAPKERQAAFLTERLAGWLPDFAAACAHGDRTGFYAAVSKAAADFVFTDLDRHFAAPIPAAEENDHA